jgi:thymidylate synthase
MSLKPIEIDVRPAVCVTVCEAGTVIAVVVLKGEEIAKLPQITGIQMHAPGRWYVASLSVMGKQMMKFSHAEGEFLSITEAEKHAQKIARELAQRIQEKSLQAQLIRANAGPRQ